MVRFGISIRFKADDFCTMALSLNAPLAPHLNSISLRRVYWPTDFLVAHLCTTCRPQFSVHAWYWWIRPFGIRAKSISKYLRNVHIPEDSRAYDI